MANFFISNTLELVKIETGRKAAKYRYEIRETATGTVISTRESNRDYAACTKSGSLFFGRMDLVGKGEHGRIIKSTWFASETPEQQNFNLEIVVIK